MWLAFYHTEIQNESSENWFTNVSALKIEKSKSRHSPLAHIHQWVQRPHGVTGVHVGSLHWPILMINFSPTFFGECQQTKLFTFRTWHDSSKTSLLLSFRGVEEKKNYLHREEKERKHVDTDNTTHIYIYIFSKGAKLIGLLCQHKFFFLFFSLNSQ